MNLVKNHKLFLASLCFWLFLMAFEYFIRFTAGMACHTSNEYIQGEAYWGFFPVIGTRCVWDSLPEGVSAFSGPGLTTVAAPVILCAWLLEAWLQGRKQKKELEVTL